MAVSEWVDTHRWTKTWYNFFIWNGSYIVVVGTFSFCEKYDGIANSFRNSVCVIST